MSKIVKVFCGPNRYHFSRLYQKDSDEYIVGVDSGLEYLIDYDIAIDLAVGDFDSISKDYIEAIKQKSLKVIELDVNKKMTDLAFAVEYIYSQMEYDEMIVYGGLGGRIDHTLANMNLLKRYDIKFMDDHHLIYGLKKGKYFLNHPYKNISFFAMEDCYNLSINGFLYELDNYYLGTSDSLCVSNQGKGEVQFSKGRLLVVCTNEDEQIQANLN